MLETKHLKLELSLSSLSFLRTQWINSSRYIFKILVLSVGKKLLRRFKSRRFVYSLFFSMNFFHPACFLFRIILHRRSSVTFFESAFYNFSKRFDSRTLKVTWESLWNSSHVKQTDWTYNLNVSTELLRHLSLSKAHPDLIKMLNNYIGIAFASAVFIAFVHLLYHHHWQHYSQYSGHCHLRGLFINHCLDQLFYCYLMHLSLFLSAFHRLHIQFSIDVV